MNTKMNDSKSKVEIAEQLRAFAQNPVYIFAIASIEGLGELGGADAVNHIEELMDLEADKDGPNGKEKWAALLRAYGRAGRFLPK